jgi:hypothetical protein
MGIAPEKEKREYRALRCARSGAAGTRYTNPSFTEV